MTIQEQITDLENDKAILIKGGLVGKQIIDGYDLKIQSLKAMIGEKKNESEVESILESVFRQNASATSADATPQSSTTKESSPTKSDVGDNNIVVDSDSLLEEKWIGKASKEKFKDLAGFDMFKAARKKLRNFLMGILKLKTPTSDAKKKQKLIDLQKELARVIKNEAKKRYVNEILSMKFFLTKGGDKKVFYGCNEKLDNVFGK